MRNRSLILVLLVLGGGCVQIPSRDSIRARYKAPGPLASELMSDAEIKDLILKASASGLPLAEKKRLFQRFETAIDRCAKRRDGKGIALDLCVMQYHLFPDERKAAMNLAGAYAAIGRKQESMELLQEALRKKDVAFSDRNHAQLARIHRGLGGYYLEAGEATRAIEQLEQAAELNPKDAHPLFLLGQAYGMRFRTQGTKADLGHATDAFSRGFQLAQRLAMPEDYNLFAGLLLQEGKHKEATDTLAAAIKHYPCISAFYFNLAQYDRASGKPVRAYYLYSMAELVRIPGDRHGRLATVEIEELNKKAAKQKDDPKLEQIRCLVRGVNLANADGDFGKAAECFRKALKANGKNEFVLRFLLAGALAGAKQYDEARKLYDACIKERPWFAPAYVELGRLYNTNGDRPKAMQLWVKALEIQPQNWCVQGIWRKITGDAKRKGLEKLKETAPPQ